MSVQSEISRITQNVANTYAVLGALGADLPEEQNSDNLAATAGTAKALLYSEQSLTEEQQAQARENIGAVSDESIKDDGSKELAVADPDGNVVFRADENGVETTKVVADEVLVGGKGAATTDTYYATVTNVWTVDADEGDYFYQDIAVDGILETDNPIVDIATGEDNAANVVYGECICKVFRITTFDGSIRVWATEEISTAFPIQLKAVR